VAGIESNQVDDVHEFVIGDGFWNALVNYQYLIAEGVGHPEGKVGCEFLTSDVVLCLLNIDVCDKDGDGTFASLKPVCPLSCSCNIYPPDCPHACFN